MKHKKSKSEPDIKSWYIEDELSGIDQPKKEDIQRACELLKLPFTRESAMTIIYGDNKELPDRVLPIWFKELE